MKNSAFKIKIKKVLSNYDAVLAVLVLSICIFGLVMIYSASSYRAEYYYHDSTLYFRKQGLFIVIGTVAMIFFSLVDYKLFFRSYKWAPIPVSALVWIGSLGMCIYVVFMGHVVGGSSRWIESGLGFNIQPSEIAKVGFVLFGAFVLTKWKRVINTGSTLRNFGFFWALIVPFAAVMAPVLYLNLSSAIILGAIIGGMILCVSMDKKYLIFVGIILGILLFVILFAGGYRTERVDVWLHPEKMDPGGQIMQGMLAIGSGGLFGKGFGNSVQKLGNIPEVHTDMIFTIICEELGIIGGIALLLMMMIMLWRIFKIALRATELKGSLIATGVFVQLAVQILMNIAVVTNAMPATGVPLPFVSYGGSSLVIMMAEIGLVLNVSKQTYETIEDKEETEEE